MKNPQSSLNFLFFSTLAAIIIWIASTGAKANPFPLSPYEAHYNVNWYGLYQGKSVHILIPRQKGGYDFEVKTTPQLRLLPYYQFESSRFTWEGNQLKPHLHTYDIREGTRHKKGHLIFNWKKNTVRNTQTPPWQASLPSLLVQDKLTQMLSLRCALQTGAALLTYTVAEEDKLKDYVFKVIGEESLATVLGTLQTIKMQHISRKGYRTTLWLAKQFEYLPVKMTQHRGSRIAAMGTLSFLKID